jgi:hypothetical protein
VLDSECASNVCDLDTGACVADTSIRYAAADGVATNNCTEAAPCTLALALSIVDAHHAWVRMLPGSYATNVTISDSTVSIVGTGATLAALMTISNNASVRIRGLALQGNASIPLFCNPTSGRSQLVLRQISATSNVSTLYCDVTVTDSDFTGGGILVLGNNTVATLDRCRFTQVQTHTDSSAYSMSLQVTNSTFFVPLSLGIATGSPTAVYVAYNTFYTPSTPTSCGNQGSGVTFVNNVFYAPGSPSAIQGTTCVYDNNIAYPQTIMMVGTNTIVMDPMLVDPATGDFHLRAGSPAIDAAKPIAMEPTEDLDGTPRPQGAARDIGAIEYK